MNARNWGTGLRRGAKTICLRRYSSREDAEVHLKADHADADKCDNTTWFDTPMVLRFKPGAAVVAVLETPTVRAFLGTREQGRK